MKTFLSQLPKIVLGRKKRVGRGIGSGRGSKSGRGTTRHQKARESIPLHFEGGQGRLVKKFPLLRGKGKNKSFQKKPLILNLDWLNSLKEETIVDSKLLQEKKVFTPVKVLNKGKLTKKLIIRIPVSRSVKKLVEAAGGKVEI